jgi:hypothetical protein
LNFFVGTAPAAPVISAPTGAGITSPATFTLTAVTGATGYQIWLMDYTALTGGPLNFTVAQGGALCATPGSACNFSIPVVSGHIYGWAAAAQNAGGQGSWSSGLTFFVGALPAAPVISTPSGTSVATNATFNLTAVAGATSYMIWLQDYTAGTGGPTTFAASSGGGTCGAGSGPCSFTPTTPFTSGHIYGWAAAGQNAGGQGAWSSVINFTVL